MMAGGREHGATVERWLKDRHSEMAEDLASLLDVETGLCDAKLPSRHVDVVTDLHVVLDVEAGLAGAVNTTDVGDADGFDARPPRTHRVPTPIRRRRPYLSGESASLVRPGSVMPAGSVPAKSRLLSRGVAALAPPAQSRACASRQSTVRQRRTSSHLTPRDGSARLGRTSMRAGTERASFRVTPAQP